MDKSNIPSWLFLTMSKKLAAYATGLACASAAYSIGAMINVKYLAPFFATTGELVGQEIIKIVLT